LVSFDINIFSLSKKWTLIISTIFQYEPLFNINENENIFFKKNKIKYGKEE
jgi:hypothetical protein